MDERGLRARAAAQISKRGGRMLKKSWLGLAALGAAGASFAGTFSVTDAIPNQGKFVVVNPATQSLYVAVSKGTSLEGGPFNDIVVYSTADDTVRANIPSASPAAVVQNLILDSANDVLYAANADGTLTVIDGVTNTIDAVITVGQGPIGIAVDPGLNVAYVANANDTFISVIQGPVRNGAGAITAPAKLLRNIEPAYPPAGAIVVDNDTHTVYAVVSPGGASRPLLVAIDGTTDAITGYPLQLGSDPGPGGMVEDESTRRLLIVVNFGYAVFWVYDLQTQSMVWSLSRPMTSDSPTSAILVDSINEVAYVVGEYSIDELSLNESRIWGQAGVYTAATGACPAGVAFALDTESGLAYYTSCDRTGANLNVWDGASVAPSQVAQIPIGNPDNKFDDASGTFALAVNPATHVAYVSNSTFYPLAAPPQIAAPAIDVINGPAAGPSPELSITVSGSPSVAPQALALPLDYSFGCVAENKATPAIFTITNSSAVSAMVRAPIALGSGFTVQGGTCTAAAAVAGRGGVCEETIDFDPTVTSNYAGGLAWIDSERDTPQVMRLKGGGTGPFLNVSPNTLPAGTVGIAYPFSGQVTFSVTNAVGTSTVNICATQASGQPNKASCCPSGGGACPGILPPGMNFTAPHLFAPASSLPTSGTYPFSVIAVDSNNDRGFRNFKLIIDPAP
jgi:YVTN family beta-propeller protein